MNLLINGMFNGMEVSLINMYAPNEDKPSFNVIAQYSIGLLLISRDFNRVMWKLADRKPPSMTSLTKMSRALKHHVPEMGLVDLWRTRFSIRRDFMFFTPYSDLHRVIGIDIMATSLSDHVPILLQWNIEQRSISKLWRFNPKQ